LRFCLVFRGEQFEAGPEGGGAKAVAACSRIPGRRDR